MKSFRFSFLLGLSLVSQLGRAEAQNFPTFSFACLSRDRGANLYFGFFRA